MRRFVFAQAQLFILIWTTGGSGDSGDAGSATAQAGGNGKHAFETAADAAPLVAFLKSLNEDYQ